MRGSHHHFIGARAVDLLSMTGLVQRFPKREGEMKMKEAGFALAFAFVVGGMVAASAVAQPVPAPPRITNTYAAKFICGVQLDRDLANVRDAEAGRYATEIDVHNNSGAPISIRKKIIQLLQNPELIGEKPTAPQAKVLEVLKEDEALAVVCRDIYKLLNTPIQAGQVPPYVQGLVIFEVLQPAGTPAPPRDPLDVEGIYTYRGELPVTPPGLPASDSGVSIDVVVYPAKSNAHVLH
jgi:hypothetical protein